ncbi:major capsid protein [Phreatobacter sp. HK31-P]
MTETRLSDVIVPEIFRPYMIAETTRLDAFLESGVAADVSDEIEDWGVTVKVPFFNDLSGDSNVSDDTADIAVKGITTGLDVAPALMRDDAFGATQLSAELSGADPASAIGSRIGKYWAGERQKVLLKTLTGIFGAASMSANVFDISALTGGAENFGASAFIDATHALGDHSRLLTGIAVHSDTEKAMKKADLIDYIMPSLGGLPIPFYQGKRVVVDDSLPKVSTVYTSYLFGQGAIAYAQKGRENAVEVGRDPLKNGGRDYVITRERFSFHVRGVKWIGTPALSTPSNTELAVGTNWTRVYDPKLVRAVAFKHKIA